MVEKKEQSGVEDKMEKKLVERVKGGKRRNERGE